MKKLNHLDLGCGKNLFNPQHFNYKFDQEQYFFESFGIDLNNHNNNQIIGLDLFINKIPFQDNFFSLVTAIDFLEHVPRVIYLDKKITFPFINLMNEIYRVLIKDGIFLFRVPEFNKNFFDDPTHTNPLTESGIFSYFCSSYNSDKLMKSPSKPWGSNYGFDGDFEFISFEAIKNNNLYAHLDNNDLFFVLKKVTEK